MTTREEIAVALLQFSEADLYDAGINLFDVLGYNTSRTEKLDDNNFQGFANMFVQDRTEFRTDKALTDEWAQVEFLFQLTESEMTSEVDLFDAKEFNGTIMESYAFFAVELKGETYTRSQLAQITREFNKLFNMPAMLVYKHGSTLTLAVINRRLHKRDNTKDVLEKVTLIKDIRLDSPHRAHLEILFDLSFRELLRKYSFTSFITLHDAWTNCLDTKELNKRFYQELANWYFWAMDKVSFPDDIEKNEDIRNATNLIRLITRIIFVWFIKEKSLVPDLLFNQNSLATILKDFNKNDKSYNYYQAILQNLFFGTLNQRMDERVFAKDGGRPVNRNEYGVKNLFRYANKFTISEKEVLALFADIPFLNGGLFDCLDKEDEKGTVVYVDGFSRESKKQAKVPDYLFFSQEQEVDLNEIYGTRSKRYHAKGLINILDSYKFTVAENTPLEEEIALDPELLGKVFENLLASYNPETQTTARKQTGSFYTPREIVNYMVDESLLAYLQEKLEEKGYIDCEDQLRDLLSYSENPNPFDDNQTNLLIQTIDNCKILDPACGSGAFPMGVLLKLVHVLQKLDPENAQWKERQKTKASKIDDPEIRQQALDKIEDAFINNELDYGRKLFLIENCIYGVDIQPVAVQIAKLRFFISLIIDQKTQPAKENLGIQSLPNLETKFVAANTLIDLEKPDVQGTLRNPEIVKLENELKDLRHQYFNARTRNEKLKYQRKDKKLRQEIAGLLVNDGWDNRVAQQIVDFNPYDQNKFAPFFDSEWMFGVKDGFDIVIGNPPYVRADNPAIAEQREQILKSKQYYTLWEKWDLMIPFVEKGIRLLNRYGINYYILSNSITTSKYAEKLQKWIIANHFVRSIDYFEDIEVFEAGVIPVILAIQNTSINDLTLKNYRKETFENVTSQIVDNSDKLNLRDRIFRHSYSSVFSPPVESELLGNICYISVGMVTNSNEKDAKGEFVKDDLISDTKDYIHCKEYVEGKAIKAYKIEQIKYIEYNTDRVPDKLRRPTFRQLYDGEKILRGRVTQGTYDDSEIVCNDSIMVMKRFVDLRGINERSINVSISKNNLKLSSKKTLELINKKRQELEKTSQKYSLKYILGIINSKYSMAFLNNFRRHRLENYFYPDDFRNFPIAYTKSEIQRIFDYFVNLLLFVNKLQLSNNFISFFECIVDAMVYELYLSKEVTVADASVLRYLDNLPGIQPLIEKGQTEKALKTIEKVYQEFSDPNHPVNIAMARMQEIEEVQIIEGKK